MTKTEISFNPPIPLLGIYLKELKTNYFIETCKPMFQMVQLTIVKLWKQIRHPSTDEQMKKRLYRYMFILFSNLEEQNHVICKKMD